MHARESASARLARRHSVGFALADTALRQHGSAAVGHWICVAFYRPANVRQHVAEKGTLADTARLPNGAALAAGYLIRAAVAAGSAVKAAPD